MNVFRRQERRRKREGGSREITRERERGRGAETEGKGEERDGENTLIVILFHLFSRWLFDLIHGTTIGLLVELFARK